MAANCDQQEISGGSESSKNESQAENGTTVSSGEKRFQVHHLLSISRWKWNASTMGLVLNLGRNYYVGGVRALLRETTTASSSATSKNGDTNSPRKIGLLIEAFGYRDLRAAHVSKVFRHPSQGSSSSSHSSAGTQLRPVEYEYLKSTTTYKLCILYFRADDFLPKCSYTFVYNDTFDYATSVLLKDLTSLEDLFEHAPLQDSSSFAPTVNVMEEWNLTDMDSSIRSLKEKGDWGNPNGLDARFEYPDVAGIVAYVSRNRIVNNNNNNNKHEKCTKHP